MPQILPLRRIPFRGTLATGIGIALLTVGGGWAVWSLWGNSASARVATAESDPRIKTHVGVVDFEEKLALFETVFWEPRDTTSLRDLIRATNLVRNKDVLEIGTGSGLISLCCAKAGARKVVATDINPNAIANARYNAEQLGLSDHIEVRQVSRSNPGAFAVLRPEERFDLIISNPPWEDRRPQSIDQYALDDEGFALMRSLLKDLKRRLKPGGRAFLAYGCVSAIRALKELAPQHGLEFQVFDKRNLDDLEEVFLPGMLVIVWPKTPSGDR